MDGTLMVMESAVTFSTTPVVIPHCVSHPALGGKTLQSQVAVFGGSVGPEVVTGVGLSGGAGAGGEGHPMRNGMAHAATTRRADLL
jgi:hypothetical protein